VVHQFTRARELVNYELTKKRNQMSPSLREQGKPHIFLLRDPQREKENVKNYTRSTEAIAEYADIVDVLYQVIELKQISEGSLDLLAQRLGSRFKLVADAAGTRLIQLSHYFPAVQQKLLELMDDHRHQIRLRVVQSIWTDTPPQETTDVILRKGLKDKSATVRQFAVSRIGSHRLKHFQRDISHLLQKETSEKVIAEGQYALQQLQD
jgi:hypothetical protein